MIVAKTESISQKGDSQYRDPYYLNHKISERLNLKADLDMRRLSQGLSWNFFLIRDGFLWHLIETIILRPAFTYYFNASFRIKKHLTHLDFTYIKELGKQINTVLRTRTEASFFDYGTNSEASLILNLWARLQLQFSALLSQLKLHSKTLYVCRAEEFFTYISRSLNGNRYDQNSVHPMFGDIITSNPNHEAKYDSQVSDTVRATIYPRSIFLFTIKNKI